MVLVQHPMKASLIAAGIEGWSDGIQAFIIQGLSERHAGVISSIIAVADCSVPRPP